MRIREIELEIRGKSRPRLPAFKAAIKLPTLVSHLTSQTTRGNILAQNGNSICLTELYFLSRTRIFIQQSLSHVTFKEIKFLILVKICCHSLIQHKPNWYIMYTVMVCPANQTEVCSQATAPRPVELEKEIWLKKYFKMGLG